MRPIRRRWVAAERAKKADVAASVADAAKEAHERLVELVAEGKDELMEEYFEKGTIPEEDLVPALREAIREDKLFPVSLLQGWGISASMN